MWIYFLVFGSAVLLPLVECNIHINNGQLNITERNYMKRIIPARNAEPGPAVEGEPPLEEQSLFRLSPVFRKDNKLYREFDEFFTKGIASKALIFNIYDDDMRDAAIALFKLLQYVRSRQYFHYCNLKIWLKDHINGDMLDYTMRLTSLHGPYNLEENFLPPFVINPNYFINGETIMKAFYIKQNLGKIKYANLLNEYQAFYFDKDSIFINSNYSGWNIPLEGDDSEIKYFIEDVGLNSYYYGVHLLHPFWMDYDQSGINAKNNEHYYFTHRQLYNRYLLEKEHITASSDDKQVKQNFEPNYFPYLYYPNGMPFPTRSSKIGDKLQKDLDYLKERDAIVKWVIRSKGIVLQNLTTVYTTAYNYVDLVTGIFRRNFDSIKSAKILRSVFGYGNNGYPIDGYNPSPSVLHHPQTTLRDPVYWRLMQRALDDYYSYLVHKTDQFDISGYDTGEFVITDAEFSQLTTTFDYYFVNLLNSLEGDTANYGPREPHIFARQRRLNHKPFTMNFTVVSMDDADVIVRLYLGPECSRENCWNNSYKFFQLDCYRHQLFEGKNYVIWDPAKSEKYAPSLDMDEDNYDIYMFPRNLVLPKGLEHGLNLTLFIMITEDNGSPEPCNPTVYDKVSYEVDEEPLGFPFHNAAPCELFPAHNYKFFNITVYHSNESVDEMGYFSPFLN